MRPTKLVTLKIVRWRENPAGFSVWDRHARTELKRRLQRAINASPKELRDLSRRILEKEAGVVLDNVREDAAFKLEQIIATLGADVVRE